MSVHTQTQQTLFFYVTTFYRQNRIIPCRVLLEKRFGYISKCYSGNKGIVLYSVYLEKLSDIHGTKKQMTIATQFCNISFLQQLCDYTSVNFILEIYISRSETCAFILQNHGTTFQRKR
mmetsp:Transcript_42737/g.64293  ORF Transcript_42737/g.64293 Transcript_42737/m.64293 type:complete len:119 (-) Transcript_42737:1661-2017(-)